jgi:hypothetical protein
MKKMNRRNLEDIAANWLVMDKEIDEREIKEVFNNPQVKLPLAYVYKHRNVLFNERAKKFERIEEIEWAIKEMAVQAGKPLVILLTQSLGELAHLAPDTRVSHVEGKPTEDFK